MRRVPKVGDWIAINAPDGYQLEMDVSHPHGSLRHRLLPDGEWRDGRAPVDLSLEEIIGPSTAVKGETATGAAREFLEDFDRKTR